MTTAALLFERDQVDEVDVWTLQLERLGRRSILWIDLDRDDGTLRGQLEEVVQVARDSRDSVFGSFDVLIARTEHRTNEIMKVLTLGALLFLPGALIAGVLGMNFKVGLFDTGWYFWVVCAGIVGLAAATLAVARAREWI